MVTSYFKFSDTFQNKNISHVVSWKKFCDVSQLLSTHFYLVGEINAVPEIWTDLNWLVSVYQNMHYHISQKWPLSKQLASDTKKDLIKV